MSVARTARRRRRQYKIGNLEQIFGKRAAPHYGRPVSREISARREAAYRERQRKIASRKRGK